MTALLTVVDFVFPITGKRIAFDHGYHLFAALVEQERVSLHGRTEIGILPIAGRNRGRWIEIDERSALVIRAPMGLAGELRLFEGARLVVGREPIVVGEMSERPLTTARELFCRLALIKAAPSAHQKDPERFLECARRQIAQRDIAAELEIPRRRDGSPMRRVARVGRYTIHGYGLTAHCASSPDAVALQIHGIGGKRRFGCGSFTATHHG